MHYLIKVLETYTSITVPLASKEVCMNALNRETLKDVKQRTQTDLLYINKITADNILWRKDASFSPERINLNQPVKCHNKKLCMRMYFLAA